MKLLLCRLFPLTLLACGLAGPLLHAQEGPLDSAPPQGITPDEIIKRFSAKETEFAKAREQYTYRQDVKVETLDGDTVDGQYREVFDVLFDDKGKRLENVVFAPQSSLTKIYMSQEDMQDIRHMLPFVLTTEEIPEYNILYVGQQQEDELHCYVFDIAPKKIEGKKRYFQGRVWVYDQDFQIEKPTAKPCPTCATGVRAMRSRTVETTRIYSPSSPPGGSRSTANTGFLSIPGPTTNCTSRRRTSASARS